MVLNFHISNPGERIQSMRNPSEDNRDRQSFKVWIGIPWRGGLLSGSDSLPFIHGLRDVRDYCACQKSGAFKIS